MKAQEAAGATAAGGRHGTRQSQVAEMQHACSAELAAGGGASPLEPQKERRAPGLLSVRD
jgi:hypothetical protein